MIRSQKDSSKGFFDHPENITRLLRGFYVLCIVLVAMDFFVHRHIYTELEKIPAFYAIFGFLACVLLVLLAKVLRIFLMRSEQYYQDQDDETAPKEKAHHVD
ncbi:hypothetical protein DXV75_13290 [Alteromonas aestuariivivens]|uniref:Uncharacterized protein n=1 Tax=Alteromonas aestuariivivens TaxID=1938339 RepID=A0A3D8M4R6_9ALTE|nr:hypothetical protein [Alteromonas aestuariivivens]RDV24656.1 hypothetical protein DXV75_13290 [Alteromonas aestuariivivens]